MRENFKKQIAIPQDHGSWVFILSPLFIGIFAGGKFNYATLSLIIGAMSAFMIRQPMTVFVKAVSGRRPEAASWPGDGPCRCGTGSSAAPTGYAGTGKPRPRRHLRPGESRITARTVAQAQDVSQIQGFS